MSEKEGKSDMCVVCIFGLWECAGNPGLKWKSSNPPLGRERGCRKLSPALLRLLRGVPWVVCEYWRELMREFGCARARVCVCVCLKKGGGGMR